MAEIRLSPEARRDLADIDDYGAEHFGAAIADDYSRGFAETFDMLAKYPSAGRARPELGKGVRSILHERHHIFYRVQRANVLVARILHHARDERTALGRKRG